MTQMTAPPPVLCVFAAMMHGMASHFPFRPLRPRSGIAATGFKHNHRLAPVQQALLAMLFAVSTATAPLTAHAQAGAACVPGGTVDQTNACAVQAFQTADTDNNILYGDVMRILSAHERPALRRDQNEWTRHRAATCKKHEAAHEGKPDWTRRYHDCLVAETAKRKKELMVWLHEGPPPGALQK